jgi:hypothetical protein
MKQTMTHKLGVLAATAGLMLLLGCSDTTAPQSWAGSYVSATKFGGASGTWNAAGVLVVGSSTDIQWNAVAIVNPTWQADTLSWAIADGNAGNAKIAFKTSSSDAYYWDAPVQGKLFEGAYQNPGEGWVDFRGIVQ